MILYPPVILAAARRLMQTREEGEPSGAEVNMQNGLTSGGGGGGGGGGEKREGGGRALIWLGDVAACRAPPAGFVLVFREIHRGFASVPSRV